jgi:hypothetical protein
MTSETDMTFTIRRLAGALVSILVVGLATMSACRQDDLGGPARSIKADFQPGDVVGTAQAPTPPENNISFPDWQNTGIAIPPGLAVRISVSGKLTFSANPGYTACSNQSVPQLPGGVTEVGPAGFDPNRQFEVVVGVGTATQPPGAGIAAFQPLQASADSISAIDGLAGVLWVSRPGPYYSACESEATGYQPAYFIDGTQTISATVLPAPVIVPDRTTIVPGDTINATLEVSWTNDILVRYGWEWVPAPNGGNATFVSGCGLYQLTCRLVVLGDGSLRTPDVFLAQSIYMTAVSPVIHVEPPHL